MTTPWAMAPEKLCFQISSPFHTLPQVDRDIYLMCNWCILSAMMSKGRIGLTQGPTSWLVARWLGCGFWSQVTAVRNNLSSYSEKKHTSKKIPHRLKPPPPVFGFIGKKYRKGWKLCRRLGARSRRNTRLVCPRNKCARRSDRCLFLPANCVTYLLPPFLAVIWAVLPM